MSHHETSGGERDPADGATQTGAARGRGVRIAFAALALGSLLLGAAIHLFAARLGLAPDTARVIATAFIGAGILDAAVLYFWERLFPAG